MSRSIIISHTTPLLRSADWVWEKLQRTDTLRYVAEGLIDYRGSLPEVWEVGTVVDLKPKFVTGWLRHLPAGRHMVSVTTIDHEQRRMMTTEHGGLVKIWNHEMYVEQPKQPNRCYYVDTVYIEAGWATSIVGHIANQLYAHRHKRWLRLIAESH